MHVAEARTLLKDFLEAKAPLTRLAYERDIRDFAAFLRARSPAAAVKALLSMPFAEAAQTGHRYRAWLEYRKRFGWKFRTPPAATRRLGPKTVNRHVATLRSLVRFAHSCGQVEWLLSVPSIRTLPIRDTRGPGADAVRRMIELATENRSRMGLRDRALLVVLFALGLRNSEVRALNVGDFTDVPDGPALAVRRKGWRESRINAIPIRIAATISEWLIAGGLTRKTESPLFPNLSRVPAHKGDSRGRLTSAGLASIVRKYGALAGVRATPHGLRHSAITAAAESSAFGVLALSRFSGHRDVRTLSAYLDLPKDAALEVADFLTEGALR